MKPEGGPQAELTYGAIILVGVTAVSTGLAVFPTSNKILGAVLIGAGLVTIVAAALLVDCLLKRFRACRRVKPPAYDAVASLHAMEAGEAGPPTEPNSEPLRRPCSLSVHAVTPLCHGHFAVGSDLSSGRSFSAPPSELDLTAGRLYRVHLRLDSPLSSVADRLLHSTVDEPRPERADVSKPLPPAPDASSDGEHPASSEAGKCAPRAPFCKPPSYDEVLADDHRGRGDSVASPESQTLPAVGGRMTLGRSSAPEIPCSPLSIGAAPMGR
ncbi:uncharacterized protein LOC144112801 [Amblyomma americanum]